MSQFFTMSFGFVVMAALVDIMANMANKTNIRKIGPIG